MAKKTIRDLPKDLAGKRVLVRFDLNVGIDEKSGEIRNDRRIRSSLDTLRYLLNAKAAVILLSHLGRPKAGAEPAKNAPFKMDYVARRLGEYLTRPVQKVDEVVGPLVKSAVAALRPGDVLLLENTRFHKNEQPKKEGTPQEIAAHEAEMETLAKQWAELGDIYVNDAFGALQNKNVSVLGLPKAMKDKPRVIGLLVEKELRIIDDLLDHIQRPMVAIMGGAKVTDKIKFIQVLLGKVDKLLIGGKMTYTFFKAQGVSVGAMDIDAAEVKEAKMLLPLVGTKIVLPSDSVVVAKDDLTKTLTVEGPVPYGYAGADIGPETISAYTQEIGKASTVIWNGPVGWFENKPFDIGTRAIAEALARRKAAGGITVVGGGETAEAVEEFGLVDAMSHVSTGGGAFLKYVEERKFKTLDQIEDKA